MNLRRVFRVFFRQKKLDAEMAEEIRAHVELRTQRNIASGLSPEEARYAAQRAFGGAEQIKERCRDERRWLWLEQALQDARFSLRVLAKAPGFTAAAVLVLALGIGLNTAMFNVIYALAFSPRHVSAPDRLVQIYTQDKKERANFRPFSHAAYRELRERRDIFTGVLAQKLSVVAIGESGEARRMLAALVSANYFDVLGVRLTLGRSFTAAEETPGAELPVAIVSHRYWRNSGARSDLVGATVRINGRPFTIIGITPENFAGTMEMLGPDFFLPLGMFDSLPDSKGGAHRSLARADVFALLLFGRLQDGVTAAAASSALAGAGAGLEGLYPIEYQDKTLLLGPLPRGFPDAAPPSEGPIRLMAVVLLGLTGIVLLIVSLNLAGLLLVRGHARRKEFAIRLALGGTRGRLVRQLLTEGLALALAGGALGSVCAMWATDLLLAAVSDRLPVELLLTLRAPVATVGATLVCCVLATLFFALGPALTLARRDVIPDLQQNAAEDAGRRRRWLPRHPLVVAQIALSLALMIGAGLFVRMVTEAAAEDTGVHADQTLLVEFDASLTGHDRARSLEVFRTVHERVAALPGLSSVSIAASAPYSVRQDNRSVRRAGARPAEGVRPASAAEGLAFSAPYNAVGAEFFSTVSLPLLRGRAFTPFEADHLGAPPVAIVDEALAKLLWPGEDALGRRIEWAARDSTRAGEQAGAESMVIVGIARTTHPRLFEKTSSGAIYIPFAQGFTGNVYFFVRSAHAGEAALNALREPVRRELQGAAPDVPFFKVRTFPEHKNASLELWLLHRISFIASAFSGIAAVIAVIGLYGAKAYGVSRRTREIGIRLALGGEPARLRNQILREGLASGLLGIALGLLLGAALGRVLDSMIVELVGFDPIVFGFAALAVLAAALAASWLPARRAARVDPMVALRTE